MSFISCFSKDSVDVVSTTTNEKSLELVVNKTETKTKDRELFKEFIADMPSNINIPKSMTEKIDVPELQKQADKMFKDIDKGMSYAEMRSRYG